jgi:hypothetical protein
MLGELRCESKASSQYSPEFHEFSGNWDSRSGPNALDSRNSWVRWSPGGNLDAALFTDIIVDAQDSCNPPDKVFFRGGLQGFANPQAG